MRLFVSCICLNLLISSFYGFNSIDPPPLLPKSVKVDTILQVQFIVYKDPGPVDQISHRSWSFFPASDLQLNYFHYSTYMNLTQWDRVGIFQTPPNANEKFKFLRYHSFFSCKIFLLILVNFIFPQIVL